MLRKLNSIFWNIIHWHWNIFEKLWHFFHCLLENVASKPLLLFIQILFMVLSFMSGLISNVDPNIPTVITQHTVSVTGGFENKYISRPGTAGLGVISGLLFYLDQPWTPEWRKGDFVAFICTIEACPVFVTNASHKYSGSKPAGPSVFWAAPACTALLDRLYSRIINTGNIAIECVTRRVFIYTRLQSQTLLGSVELHVLLSLLAWRKFTNSFYQLWKKMGCCL